MKTVSVQKSSVSTSVTEARQMAAPKIPTGYKMTELGVIPKDWHIKTLSELAKICSGGTPSTTVSLYWDGNIDWCTPTDITKLSGRKYIISTDRRISEAGLKSSSAELLPCMSIVMTSRATIGECAINIHPICTNQGFKNFIPYTDSNVQFLYYLLTQQKQRFISLCTGSTFLEIGKKQLDDFKVIFPNSPEQYAIAEALSDVDDLIAAQEELIAKKRNIKQATMQELLTGRTRLTGFKSKWKNISMLSDATLKARIGWQGLTTEEYLKAGDYMLVTGTDFDSGKINWSSCWYVDKHRYIQDANIQLKLGDVLLTKDGTIGKAGYIDTLPMPATLNSGIFVIRPIGNAFNPQFFFYILTSRVFDDFLNRLQAGSTIVHLYQKDFITFHFSAPSEIEEQEAIASVLSDMDSEISALETELEKTKAIKQGMMQELLTGRIRLI